MQTPPKIVVMGVSGCGKSTIAELLARQMALRYRDGDGLHPPANVEKMRRGDPLTDADRAPWLDLVGQALADQCDVIACSALKRSYRDRIRRHAPDAIFVHLAGDRAVLKARVGNRPGHFMPASLLDSQLDTLEQLAHDEAGFIVDLDQTPEAIVEQAIAHLPPAERS
ncbi:gluconate kinase, SKI family [Loktanella fryxellensis]|uniref:Gluconokinase n=1 Tax=Loktanella fryxellensis TaxID=245187 RepID=A0A1H8FVW3_9RHOB|nr:gluconokinase [Loktanella fryxellensis]SEN35961.1 gluconate kinase, SKI family [Loktanella fryxellensis]